MPSLSETGMAELRLSGNTLFDSWLAATDGRYDVFKEGERPTARYDVDRVMLLPQEMSILWSLIVLLLLLRWVLSFGVFRPFGKWYAKFDDKDVRLTMFAECMWKVMYYTVASTWGWMIVLEEDFPWDTAKCFEGWSLYHNGQMYSSSIKLFYLFQLAFYLGSLFTHFMWDFRRRDWIEIAIHHMAAIALLYFSYYIGFLRFGIIVMACLDPCDVMLEAAKSARYVDHDFLTQYFFCSLLVTWLVLRVVLFPLWPLHTALVKSWPYAVAMDAVPHWAFFNALLWIIQGLQLFWLSLIVKVVMRAVQKGELEDIREE